MRKQETAILMLLVVFCPVIIAVVIPSNNKRMLKIEVLEFVNVHYEQEVPDLRFK